MSKTETALSDPPSRLSGAEFLARYGEIYESSPWVAEAVRAEAESGALDSVERLGAAMRAAVDGASHERKLALIQAHPDLAGRAAVAGALSPASSAEQTGAGLDRLSPEQYARFKTFNQRYKARFGFPFIIAVRGLDAAGILADFERRLDNDAETEFETAIAEIHKIAAGRLAGMAANGGGRSS